MHALNRRYTDTVVPIAETIDLTPAEDQQNWYGGALFILAFFAVYIGLVLLGWIPA